MKIIDAAFDLRDFGLSTMMHGNELTIYHHTGKASVAELTNFVKAKYNLPAKASTFITSNEKKKVPAIVVKFES